MASRKCHPGCPGTPGRQRWGRAGRTRSGSLLLCSSVLRLDPAAAFCCPLSPGSLATPAARRSPASGTVTLLPARAPAGRPWLSSHVSAFICPQSLEKAGDLPGRQPLSSELPGAGIYSCFAPFSAAGAWTRWGCGQIRGGMGSFGWMRCFLSPTCFFQTQGHLTALCSARPKALDLVPVLGRG